MHPIYIGNSFICLIISPCVVSIFWLFWEHCFIHSQGILDTFFIYTIEHIRLKAFIFIFFQKSFPTELVPTTCHRYRGMYLSWWQFPPIPTRLCRRICGTTCLQYSLSRWHVVGVGLKSVVGTGVGKGSCCRWLVFVSASL